MYSREGINGTIAALENNLDICIAQLTEWSLVRPSDVKYSWSDVQPFYRMRITVKSEIVTLGLPHINPCHITNTKYVDHDEWNTLLKDNNTIVVDTRNDYEVKIGSFENAINPSTKTFREFPKFVDEKLNDAKDKNIAIFCTGGIRCEKAAAYLESQGFQNVYNLKGGVLKYLEEVTEEESLWKGECFVFDQRTSVVHGLKQGSCQLCRACKSKSFAVCFNMVSSGCGYMKSYLSICCYFYLSKSL